MIRLILLLLTLLISMSGPAMGENRDFGRSSLAANSGGKGLGNPFKDKTAAQIDEMFTKKGYTKSGPDPAGGTGGYVNPKTGRSYHIDPKDWGKYREPNHVDVNRLRDYKGPLEKKKLPYLEE